MQKTRGGLIKCGLFLVQKPFLNLVNKKPFLNLVNKNPFLKLLNDFPYPIMYVLSSKNNMLLRIIHAYEHAKNNRIFPTYEHASKNNTRNSDFPEAEPMELPAPKARPKKIGFTPS